MNGVTKDKIAVMQAWVDGKKVQFQKIDGTVWEDCRFQPAWDWWTCRYRVKPEPREWWISPNYGAVFTKFPGDNVRFAADFSVARVIHVREVLE